MVLRARERAEVARVGGRRAGLDEVHARVAPRFARPEVRARAGRDLAGLLGGAERKNGRRLAEELGERAPDGVPQRRTARWDADAVRDDLRAYAAAHLGNERAVLEVDETGFRKKGTKAVGVQRQYSGTAGRVENGQLGVFLADASPTGRAFLDRTRSLPKTCAADRARRAAAGVPEGVGFATKGELARRMLERAFAAGVPAAWTSGDEVYGNDGGPRRGLEAERRPHVLAVARTHPLWHGGAQVRAEALLGEVPDGAWERLAVGAGGKGPRLYDWARARLPYRTEDGWAQWLLLRRPVAEPTEVAFCRAFGRDDAPVEQLARAAGARWVIEEGVERAKERSGWTSTRCGAGRPGTATSPSAFWPTPSWR